MADNVQVTAGSGTTISTEEVSTLNGGSVTAQHVQRMLAAIRTADGTAIDLPGDATNGLDVDVTRLPSLPAGSNAIGTVEVTRLPALPAGSNSIGTVVLGAGSAAVGRVDVGSALPAGNNNIGDVDIASIAAGSNAIGNVGLIARTSGGASIFRSIDLDETEEDVKTSAGQLYGYYFANLHATSWRYVKLYNATAASVTVGTTTPVLTLPLPPNSAGHIPLPVPVAFSTAISAAATTGVADSDTGEPGANEVVFNAYYA